MTNIQSQRPAGHALHERLHHVKALRDDLRLKIDLFESDSRAELAELEAKVERMERELSSATDDTVEAVAQELQRLSMAFRKLRRRATAERRPA